MTLLVRGKQIPPPVDESIRLFNMCQAFGFKHLPEAGGLYDQHPDLMDRFMFILAAQQEQREREEAAERRKGPKPNIRRK